MSAFSDTWPALLGLLLMSSWITMCSSETLGISLATRAFLKNGNAKWLLVSSIEDVKTCTVMLGSPQSVQSATTRKNQLT